MHFSTIFAASALAATALAAPQRPQQYGRPGRPYGRPTTTAVSSESECAAGATTTEYVTVTEAPEAPEATTSAVESVTESVITVDPITPSESATVIPSASATISYSAGNDTIPGPTGTAVPTPERCLTQEEAEAMGGVFQRLIQNYSDELALEALTEDFIDWSSSVNSLMNKGAQYPKNITGPTFASRAAFIEGQGAQPLIPFEILNLFVGCNHVTVRWVTTDSAAGKPTRAATIPAVGNGIMDLVPADDNQYGWRVKQLFSEWNTGAWYVNLGWFVPEGEVDYISEANATNSTTKREAGADEQWWQNMI